MAAGNPLEPCPVDSLNGYHEWVPMASPAPTGATGDPKPGARYCVACGAADYGPQGLRLNHKDNLEPLFPAATRSFRNVVTHNPDDPSPIAQPGSETH